MAISFSEYKREYLAKMTAVWNDILEDGVAFPGVELYEEADFERHLKEQSAATCMLAGDELAGYYILHPNNVGRCSHVANATYCMDKAFRGRGIFSALVEKSLAEAKELGFRGIQFNAVVATNDAAIHTYVKNGFEIIGTIRGGFQLKDGTYSNMYILYRDL